VGQVLSVSELEKIFEVRKTSFSLKKEIIKAVDKVSFDLEEGRTLGIVGESGSGKSTLARCLVLLEKPDGGAITFFNQNLLTIGQKSLKELRKNIQIIFQDPYSSLNPRKKVFDAIAEPLIFHNIVNGQRVYEKVIDVLRNVGLDEDFLNKYPHEMSGGQRQRVAIGRALAVNPSLLITDEPVSSLDVSIQAQIINLLMDIKEQSGISMIFVSHDLNIVRFISDEIMVMYKGKILEIGEKNEVFYHPFHPYTRMLITAAQGGFCVAKEKDEKFATDDACVYYQRCELSEELCAREMPELIGTKEHRVACFKEANNLY
jgi:oligopeptide/dipeptide ABC transporter ATP-binding protein